MRENIYLKHRDVERYCKDIGDQIKQSDWRPDYIVGLTRGGLLPATLLSQYLDVRMHSLDVALRDHVDEMGPESNCWMAEDAIEGKNILIVDDINDSGATLKWIHDDWRSLALPDDLNWVNVFDNNVRIATMVHNLASDWQLVYYTGMEINKAEKDTWVVFPWEEWWEL